MTNNVTMECDGTKSVVVNSNLDDLMAALKEGIVQMYYRKKDGTLREAFGTLSPFHIPHLYWPAGKREARPYLVNYWDLEKGGWRAFQRTRFEYFYVLTPEELEYILNNYPF